MSEKISALSATPINRLIARNAASARRLRLRKTVLRDREREGVAKAEQAVAGCVVGAAPVTELSRGQLAK